jgi:hypothetical protein
MTRDELELLLNRCCPPILVHAVLEYIEEQRAELATARGALKFYAEPQHYGIHGGSNEWVLGDAGKRARVVLQQKEQL